MAHAVSVNRVGLVVGGFLGLFHLCWALLVLFGWAQAFINFVLEIHMIRPFYVILPFSLFSTIELIVLTTVLGYVFGCVLGFLWNVGHKKS